MSKFAQNNGLPGPSPRSSQNVSKMIEKLLRYPQKAFKNHSCGALQTEKTLSIPPNAQQQQKIAPAARPQIDYQILGFSGGVPRLYHRF